MSFCGVGYNSGKYGFLCYTPRQVGVKHKKLPEYQYWTNMMLRCYYEHNKVKYPTYDGCFVNELWLDYQEFANWIHPQLDASRIGWTLDKDILVKGNKEYGPETCRLIPSEINKLLVVKSYDNGYPLGVYWHKVANKYAASVNQKAETIHLGLFSTQEDAGNAYKVAKEAVIKEEANFWKDRIDPEIYETLMNYKI